MEVCIQCAKDAGYLQLELDVVADNERAVSMYKKAGFVEYGRNPKGFRSRITGFQELVSMQVGSYDDVNKIKKWIKEYVLDNKKDISMAGVSFC